MDSSAEASTRSAAPALPQAEARVIDREADWKALQNAWEDLYAAVPGASTPLDYTWLSTWWRVYGPRYGTGGLRVVTIWRGSRLVGALPLYLNRCGWGPWAVGHLRFISTGEEEIEETCPDYMGLLCRPGEEDLCAAMAWDEVRRLDWDHLELLDMGEESPLARCPSLPPGAGWLQRGGCPVADLSEGFESYLAKLSTKTHKQARRLLREGQRAEVRFEIVGADQIDSAFEDMVRLHEERWAAEGKPGAFASRRFVEFHRNLIAQWLPSGRAVLARLSLPNQPLAVIYGFISNRKFDFYQSGIQREAVGRLVSHGTLANLLLMQALALRGVTAYDFLRGSSFYKERLATGKNGLVGLEIWRASPQAALHRLARLAARAGRKVRELAKKK